MAYLLNYYYVVNEWDLGFAFLLFLFFFLAGFFIIKKKKTLVYYCLGERGYELMMDGLGFM